MEELVNLPNIASIAGEKVNQYAGDDFVLPNEFKDNVKEINGSNIIYNTYSAIIETKGNHKLNIYLPNQWFYISSYFIDFYNELRKYKALALKVVSKERLRVLNNSSLTETEKQKINSLKITDNSKQNLIKFITDYSWWGGAKTIDRGDFYVSPILSYARLVNASQSYVAELCAFLANKQSLTELIKGEIESKITAQKAKEDYEIIFGPTKSGSAQKGFPAFLKACIEEIKRYDPKFQIAHDIIDCYPEKILFNKCIIGLSKSEISKFRESDYNINVTFDFNGKQFVLYKEQTQDSVRKFSDGFNNVYAGQYKITINENNNYPKFTLWRKTKDGNSLYVSFTNKFISALKTKPFLLLAGISGTGKSRKVQELAYMTCPRDGRFDQDEAKPGNYMLIEVKPNWHDSTELLGYYSNISGKYMLTDFIRFIYKAWLNPQVPFFVCLDEMNLAPVEQYFAEYLSVLETRKDVNGTIISAELLTKESFKDIKTDRRRPITSDEDDGVRDVTESLYSPEDALTIDFIKKNGLRLPENLFVVGTVNMDDTTHQFSRKVIDRAFTIEMNGGNLADMFDKNDTLQYQEQPLPWEVIKPDFVGAQDVLDTFEEDRKAIKNKAPELLNGINQEDIFGNTPFRVSYRVMNEMILYFATLRTRNKEVSADELLNTAFMTILLQKVLPRVEGDEKALHCDDGGHSVILAKLKSFLSANFMAENSPSSTSDIYDELIKKIDEMERRLEDTYFTSFFS